MRLPERNRQSLLDICFLAIIYNFTLFLMIDSKKDVPDYRYEPVERFGQSMTANIPWNISKLSFVELLNGRLAMIGMAISVIGELLTGKGPLGQLGLILDWYLKLG